ncbi:PREDICTED: la-related protein 7 [Nicrophorus vespilloides]|uniref:La-related protein 7 n=1 Tax=Nicrophorus vespilloides TaxID=110193 RepID=A0ABM1M583_NICVS|nr:PREDICTED: la-related protein 7 [Nicrophorus vespilloides]
MGTDPSVKEGHKVGRQRKKQLYNSILKQMEFYFSDSNLSKDRFLMQLINQNEFVDLEVFLKFNKILKLTTTVEKIATALKNSELLQLSEDKTKVKRVTAIVKKVDVDDCTLYVENVQSDVTHDWLVNLFSDFGKVSYVSIPKYSHNKLNKGFAFVEFDNANSSQKCVEFFESIDCKISSQVAPEDLCSISTFVNGDKETVHYKTPAECEQMMEEEVKSDNEKKRKLENDDDTNNVEKESKKFKADESDAEDESKKKKRKLKKLKAQFKELGLQVLPKMEWKKMRNRYLNMQRDKMKQLKQHLNKRRFNNKANNHDNNEVKQQEVEEETKKLQFVPGCIVQLKFSESCNDTKKAKNDLKSGCSDIQFVDIPTTLNNDTAYLRFLTNENAKQFCSSFSTGETSLLEGDEEKIYWEKILSSRESKFKKDTAKKQRGRDKLLKKAEKELGKHIRFEEA